MSTLSLESFGPDDKFDVMEELYNEAMPHVPANASRESAKNEIMQTYVEQLKGLVDIEVEIINKVSEDPRIAKSDLKEFLQEQCDLLNTTDRVERQAERVLGKLFNRHQVVLRIYDKYEGDSEDIFNNLFGFEPNGNVAIEIGPSVFIIKCDSQYDFALICSRKYMDYDYSPTDEDLKHTYGSKATNIRNTINPSLAGGLLVFPCTDVTKPVPKGSYAHELTHALYNFVENALPKGSEYLNLLNAETDPEQKRYWVKKYYEEFRNRYIDTYASGELLAFESEGTLPSDIFDLLALHTNYGKAYDYYALYKVDIQNLVTEVQKKYGNYIDTNGQSIKASPEDLERLNEDLLKEVFVSDYRALIQTGIDAFERMLKAGYTAEEVRAILAKQPLIKWDRVTSRIVANTNPNFVKQIYDDADYSADMPDEEEYVIQRLYSKIKGIGSRQRYDLGVGRRNQKNEETPIYTGDYYDVLEDREYVTSFEEAFKRAMKVPPRHSN